MRLLFAVLMCFVGLTVRALAADIIVTRAVVVAPPNANASTIAAYFTIENHGATADQLTAISTPSAASAMLHETTNTDGVMKMNMLEKLDIAAGATVEMKPAQLHVMLVGPKTRYKTGDDVAFELSFSIPFNLHLDQPMLRGSQELAPQHEGFPTAPP
jgi:periplasmic copper chaperone A